jgi:hypothetical protein
MPLESVLVVALVLAMFGLFMTVLAAVWIWTNLPDRTPRATQPASARPASAPAR